MLEGWGILKGEGHILSIGKVKYSFQLGNSMLESLYNYLYKQ